MSGLLYHYSGSPKIYQCPGDTIILAGSSAPRVRSYSLSCMMGNNEGITGVHDGVVENLKFTSIQMPGPSQALFFVDEQTGTSTDTTSLDDGYFAINYPHGNPAYGGSSGDEYNWRDAPSSRHGDFGQFSFADGHVAKINWLESSTKDLQGGHADGTSPVDLDYKQIWQSIYPPSNW
jgi:prepilin-type processing-associated H-X9-DG protein